MDFKLELVVLPVTDVDRAKTFYANAGFNVDVDHQPNDDLQVVQLTPPGSECSLTIGKGVTPSPPGSAQGLHLVVRQAAWPSTSGASTRARCHPCRERRRDHH